MPAPVVLRNRTGRRSGGSPHRTVTVRQAELVGRRMDYTARVRKALDAAGAAQQLVAQLAPDPAGYEAIRAIHDTRRELVALLSALLEESGWLDGLCDAPTRVPGHGPAA